MKVGLPHPPAPFPNSERGSLAANRCWGNLVLFSIITAFLSACSGAAPAAITPPKQPTSRTVAATGTPIVITLTPGVSPTGGQSIDHAIGPANAFLTIIMYGDFQCKLCLDVARSLAVLRDRYVSDVRVVFRHFPQMSENDKAMIASQAAEAAAAQGKFWEMHDQLYAHQAEWSALPVDQFRAKLTTYAQTVGLDVKAFNTALDSNAALPALQKAIQDAQKLELKGAPVLLFNGQPYSGRVDLYQLDNYTRLRLLEKRWYPHQPDLQININKHYTATLVTEKGNVEIELYANAAPAAVNNFVYLARDGWYNNITFHLVIPNLLVQTGDPSGSGFGGPGYNIVDEHDNGLIFDREGMVAMASQRDKPNSGGSQFFISLSPLRPVTDYDKQFTIFGHVTSGMDVLRRLTPRNPFDELNYPNPPPGDRLISVMIKET